VIASKFFAPPLLCWTGVRTNCFIGNWSSGDVLPVYDDDVAGFDLSRPYGGYVEAPTAVSDVPVHHPNHPSFPDSAVLVPLPAAPNGLFLEAPDTGLSDELPVVFPVPPLTDQLNEGVEDRTLENGEECSLETGEECSLKDGEERSLETGEECSMENGENLEEGPFLEHPDVAMAMTMAMAMAMPLTLTLSLSLTLSFSVPLSLSSGRLIWLRQDKTRLGNLNYDALFDPRPAHRPVHQRWYYAPVSSDPVNTHVPSKRQSKPPQRLTSSKLGQVASRPQESAEVDLEFLGHSANK
jgi:hypothetical protein